jgi:hypothetical protein
MDIFVYLLITDKILLFWAIGQRNIYEYYIYGYNKIAKTSVLEPNENCVHFYTLQFIEK